MIAAAEPERGDAAEALARVVAAAWRALGPLPRARRDQHAAAPATSFTAATRRPGAARAADRARPARRHLPRGGLRALAPLDDPRAVHAASAELRAGRLPAERIEAAAVTTVLGAVVANSAQIV